MYAMVIAQVIIRLPLSPASGPLPVSNLAPAGDRGSYRVASPPGKNKPAIL
jgi:hypothetical protein